MSFGPGLLELAGTVLGVGIPEPRLSIDTAARLRRLQPGAVILFTRNVETPAQVVGLTAALRDLLDRPLILVDQEGGRVDRLRALCGRSAAPRDLARVGGVEVIREAASDTARLLAALGINFNCTPVVDLDEGQEGNGLADRCLGADPSDVARLARALVEAHAAEGVACSLKHFPGLGRTAIDTHLAQPTLALTRAELGERELIPFRLLVDAVPAIMTCHAAFPGLTGETAAASLSRSIVTDLLRRDLGFAGLALTDDLEMGATSGLSAGERAVAAILAGQDLLLYCSRLDEADEACAALVRAVSEGRLPRERLADAALRVRAAGRDVARAARPGTVAEADAMALVSRRLRSRHLELVGSGKAASA